MNKLTDKHFEKLAIITEVPLEKIVQLNSMGLIDETRALEVLIRYDWKLLKKAGTYHLAEYRMEALAAFYNVSKSKVESVVYHKFKSGYHCKECGKKLTKIEYSHGHGLCKECVVKSINKNL